MWWPPPERRGSRTPAALARGMPVKGRLAAERGIELCRTGSWFLPLTVPSCPRDRHPDPAGHLPEPGLSLYGWMRVAVVGRQGFRGQPEDRAELGAVDAGVADESKQFHMLLE